MGHIYAKFYVYKASVSLIFPCCWYLYSAQLYFIGFCFVIIEAMIFGFLFCRNMFCYDSVRLNIRHHLKWLFSIVIGGGPGGLLNCFGSFFQCY